MVIWSTLEASCPMCGNRLRLREVGSGFALGQDTDLLIRMKGKHIIQAEIHTCQGCRYSGYTCDFLRDVSATQMRRFMESISPHLGEDAAESGGPSGVARQGAVRTPLPHVQYYWAYKTAEALGLSATQQGDRLLRAYWCLRIAPSSQLPRSVAERLRGLYLKEAIRKLRQGLRSEKDRNRIYLVAELCRRNRNFLLSAGYFRKFLMQPDGARYLKTLAKKLLTLAEKKVDAEMGMEALLYDSAPDPKKGFLSDFGG